ncbi:flavin monoamine oxidase family protein [Microvirga terricola]|uniref:Tryptophan 2-monooxygenase n=1 Tax=Microvirga terricola TaxID=2719797 RepID=A0ABX0VCS7_9HYPH|nr:NAD(P)/FAD-dependent oxidoreductase [Microvirga terricola]NIX75642.1 FAD-dependent oxidoreductase [Microvirga terricola]
MNEPAARRGGNDAVDPAKLSQEPDVLIVGAGAAGIAAARRLIAARLSVVVIEARNRIGGRTLTVSMKGHPVDLGAHWLHAGPINPLVKLGRERGEPLRRAPVHGHLFIGRREARASESAALGRAFEIADRAMTQAARAREDQPAGKVLPRLGRYGARVAAIHGLVSGRPLDQVSLHDFPSMEYADNLFIAGGLGAYVARLAQGLPIRLNTAVTALDWSEAGVRVETTAGTFRAKAAVVTTPMALLQQEVIRFAPALPEPVVAAIHGFTQGVYEHVVLHWPDSPFRGPDRLASLLGHHREPPGLLTRIDGTPFHFFELDQPAAALLDGRDADAPGRYARTILADQFGHRAIRNLRVCRSTAWRHDPWSRASWAVVPPGLATIRDALKAPVDDRIWFAGEALSRAQWGTAGGAWEEGTRTAGEILERLKADLAPRKRG